MNLTVIVILFYSLADNGAFHTPPPVIPSHDTCLILRLRILFLFRSYPAVFCCIKQSTKDFGCVSEKDFYNICAQGDLFCENGYLELKICNYSILTPLTAAKINSELHKSLVIAIVAVAVTALVIAMLIYIIYVFHADIMDLVRRGARHSDQLPNVAAQNIPMVAVNPPAVHPFAPAYGEEAPPAYVGPALPSDDDNDDEEL